MYDLTHGFQLSSVKGSIPVLDIPHAEPYQDGIGGLYNPTQFITASTHSGRSSLDWEPYVRSNQSDGTVEVIDGAVELSGATFETFVVQPRPGVFYVNGAMYQIESWVDSTHITLEDTSVNAPAGSTYKAARFGFREVDPKFAVPGEMELALDELAFALSLYDSDSVNNRSRIGIYELVCPTYRRTIDIIDDDDSGEYVEWQGHIETLASYVTSSGFTIPEYIRRRGGKVYWSNYVPTVFIDLESNWTRWIRRIQRVMETLAELDIPNAPLFMNYTLEGLSEFIDTGTGTLVPEDFQIAMLESVHAFQPHQWGFWGVEDQYVGYADFLNEFSQNLSWPSSRLSISRSPITSTACSPRTASIFLGAY